MQENREPLKPLAELGAFDGESIEVEVKHQKCKHKVKVITSDNVVCSLCGVGWTGVGAFKLAALLNTP